jgi:hypothetical protein
VGPNQDINNPEVLITLAYDFQRQSDDFGDLLAEYNAQNPDVNSGATIVDVSIPFLKTDGSTQLLHGESIEPSGNTLLYDIDLVSNSVITTYINLAERFRDYWETLNNVIDQVGPWTYDTENDIDPEGPIFLDFGNNISRIRGSLGGVSYTTTSFSYSPSSSQPIPAWTGVGPTYYNYSTHPQLLREIGDMSLIKNTDSDISWETIYWYTKDTDNGGSFRGADAYFGANPNLGYPAELQYIQFYNDKTFPIYISLSMSIASTMEAAFSAGLSSWAEIGDLDDYPTPFGGEKSFLSSWMSVGQAATPGEVVSLSAERTVEIPPGKSAFIGCQGSTGTASFQDGDTGSVSITLTLDEKTITHSAVLG